MIKDHLYFLLTDQNLFEANLDHDRRWMKSIQDDQYTVTNEVKRYAHVDHVNRSPF